jgi:hypothetical protein
MENSKYSEEERLHITNINYYLNMADRMTCKIKKINYCIGLFMYFQLDSVQSFLNKYEYFKKTSIVKAYELKRDGAKFESLVIAINNYLIKINAPLDKQRVSYRLSKKERINYKNMHEGTD